MECKLMLLNNSFTGLFYTIRYSESSDNPFEKSAISAITYILVKFLNRFVAAFSCTKHISLVHGG